MRNDLMILKMFIYLVISIIGLWGVTEGQIIQDGQCDPDINVVDNFNINEFMGTWYEISRTENPYQGSDCSTIEFLNSDGTIRLNSIGVNDNFRKEFTGTVTVNDTAKMSLSLSTISEDFDFWILGINYQNFAIGYNCVNLGSTQRSVYVWILGRDSIIHFEMMISFINTVLNNLLNISLNELYDLDYSDNACYQLPEIEVGQPIVLPGQCNTNLESVQNFDAEKFAGVWHEISSYERDTVKGTCIRSEISTSTNELDLIIRSSYVSNQTLEMVTGYAELSSDGNGKLTVIMNSINETEEIWIIATDYEEYAVLYACNNLPDDQKRVYSWIASRTRQLSSSAQASVNEALNLLIDLNDFYYQTTERDDDACFYYPDPILDEPVIFRGQCDMNIPAVPNFDFSRFMGTWHEIQSYPTVYHIGTCNNALFTRNNDRADLANTQVVNERLVVVNGEALIATEDESGRLVAILQIPETDTILATDYWVLATDYDSYAFVYACIKRGSEQREIWSWKLSRTKEMPAAGTTAINEVISTVPVLDERYYQPRDQSRVGCFFYPEPKPGVPVEFPGQCDETMSVMEGFDLSQFEGTWHEIESYPKVQQTGGCINHEYLSLSSSSLSLVSSQILDQFTEILEGTVTTDSGSEAAKLTVSLTINNTAVSFPFWILDTDYTNYALAYSCINLNSDFRGIWSWKLSRTKQLSENAVQTINSAISDINVLDDIYYEKVDQSDDACFYLPELEPGEPILLFGQCDPNITVIQNFNPSRYEGRWRIIESYPTDSQIGTCNDATYAWNGDEIDVLNTQVVSETLRTTKGTALIATTDGSGKLIMNIPGDDGPTEYWILDTDYDSYALVYSCADLTSEQRRVWSWKLSRTRELTTDAVTAINQVVDRINVLNNRYYQTIDHTDEGCFYFPTPDGNPVVFRGQCDESINVVNDFDINRYMGVWYSIENYPVEFQDGTCATNDYILTSDDVEITKTQVINEQLDSIAGRAVLVGDDTIAKLTVIFPSADGSNDTVSFPYWVLATDYDNYAFVYSCINLSDEEYRSVSSWKLSRQKSLNAASVTEINSVISNIDILNQDYYVNRDHSDGGCFYYPEPVPGQPVVFPGQCDDTIQSVPNFDLDSFSGLWHEIAAYPKQQLHGHCIYHEFIHSNDPTYKLLTGQIVDQLLFTGNGSVTQTTTGNTGQFQINVDINNTAIDLPFWILATDYEDYALAYSCINIDSNTRGVWSWKLSRTKQLSENAVQTMNSTISDINVLDDMYYEKVDQSDDACFFLPDLEPGEPVVFFGQCDPNIAVIENFNPSLYEGRWRIIESYPTDSQIGTCNDATYAWNGDEIDVLKTQVVSETLQTTNGTALIATTDGSGKLIMNIPGDDGPTEYWILDTDYDSYALVYSCVDLTSEQRRVWSWKLSRTRELTTDAVTAINQVVDTINVLDNRYYQTIDHTDEGCFYFPTPDGNPVVFRGQCDESINVVTDFDINRYMGVWYSIENYPVEFQDGTCATNDYILTSDDVEITKTQVINEQLDSIAGTAVLVGDDTIAKLTVIFPSADGSNDTVSFPYWVLATDYDNYAFVYSCINLSDEEYRSVSSWKLSRQNSLNAASVTEINSVISNIDILNQDYYVNRDHSDEGCFYYPEPVPGQPVVFPGQCDDTIQSVPNFDLDSFSGLWHEIAAYPKQQQQGHCINHEFIHSNDSTYILLTGQIEDQLLFTGKGSVTQTTTDNTGQFQINVYINNTAIDLPFWILATDYEDYALAYSCINIDSNTRGVWSWKLSRTKQLSTAANTAIDEIISSVQVLGEQYYETTQQTDEVCFFYPELGPNEPVIFVGQCDQNIAVVENFNPQLYAGRWFDIESYYETSQQGTCNDASFIFSDNAFAVSNTQVVAETLDVNKGEATIASDGNGKLVVTLNISGIDVVTNYWILDTDYESYSLVYSCEDLDTETRRVNSWKLSRTRQLSDEAKSAINSVVDKINVLDEQYYNTRDHTEEACFYYPEPVPGQNVLFRGQCDQSIEVIQDFDPDGYNGIWYKIESYPEEGQDGTCATVTYVLTTDGFEVYNTQVVAQELDSRNGTAVLDLLNNTSKLIMNFPDETIPYWILATDYNNYALIYSCVRVDDEYRRVNTWKLSREKNLTEESETAINTAMNKVQVLRQPYFEISGHTEDDCFYYPDNFGGPVILNGQCEDAETEVETDFNLNDFAGTWHEAARFPSQFQTGECAASKYEVNDNSVTITQTLVYNERLTTVLGRASVSEDGKGILTASFDGIASDLTLYVLGTDYSEYALLYTCRNIDSTSKQIFSWKLSRTRSGLSNSANEKIDELVTKHVDLFGRYYKDTDQSNDACFHYPVFDELPPSIVLPGPCDDRIRAKADFDFSAYLGRWFEISKYPQETVVGECHRNEFVDIATSIKYTGTRVNDQILEVTVGSAKVVSTDGTGLLEITTVSEDETSTSIYYVLETDYNSYALLYSCRNLEDGNSEVSSWKLSRERTLSDEANNIIDNVISNTRGLLEEYYTSVSQSDEDCFYIPKENPDEIVVFRGQCGDITGIEGFDIQRYLGWWHEIERYASDNLVGVCTSARFQASGNQYQVVDTNIFHLTALLNTSTIQASSNGRLRKTLSSGQTVDIWVLATDYETYSLLYSCENINDEYRRVWSAKHSKSREFTEAAQSAMQVVIDSNLVLYTQFYLLVDQGDSACFHYPEVDTEVILPGQCDSNIPVQQNFEPVQYSGTWYVTERYPVGYKSSAICMGSRYTFNVETEVAVVLDWEIKDDILSTVEGTATLTSDDNSGRLKIVYPIQNSNDTLTKDIYILTTDYVTYSLAYTCINVNQFQRFVGVWKYSRTRTMPNSGTNAINLYMSQREELHQPYFDEIEQDEDCEEPNMAMLIKSSIIVLFVCLATQFFA